MKKTVLYIIDSLEGIGGTEQTMAASLKDIHSHYNIILVTLRSGNAFGPGYFLADKQYCLHIKSYSKIFFAVKKLKKIIKENKVDFVHSFLYWSTLVARLACGKKVPHIFKLTTIMSLNVYGSKWFSGYTKLIDRLTYKKNQVIISPTNEVLNDFDRAIGIKGKTKIIYNFVLNDFFNHQIEYKTPEHQLKLIAVGNIKDIKNYQVIIDAFQLLPSLSITLHIYGGGCLKDIQQKQIIKNKLCIKQMGPHNRIYEILPKYDAFIMSSFVEGFGIAAAEAMAAGLPLLLSDIKTFKEISKGNALFFNPSNAKSLADKITSILNNEIDLKSFSEKGKVIARENYTKQRYVKELLNLYKDII